jgi:predicted RNA-binding protein YlxR (DUF448 family)
MAGAPILETPERMKIALRKMRPTNEAVLFRLVEVATEELGMIAA